MRAFSPLRYVFLIVCGEFSVAEGDDLRPRGLEERTSAVKAFKRIDFQVQLKPCSFVQSVFRTGYRGSRFSHIQILGRNNRLGAGKAGSNAA
jgi:hypothetical protein